MAKRKPPKPLLRRQDHVSSYEHDRSPMSRMKRMAGGHEDVLQNIEVALVTAHGENPQVDDRVVHEALRAGRGRGESADPLVAEVLGLLNQVRAMRGDLDGAVWNEGLRVVDDSVLRHSKLRPGETSYLDFVADYVD